MSANLADLQPRQSRQSRTIQSRDNILPEVGTRAPLFQGSATMGSASRGDAGAEELMRTLGMASRAAQSLQSYADDKFAKDEERHAAQGAKDETSGHVDPGLMAKSAAYKSAVSLGRTATTYDDAQRTFVHGLDGFIEQQSDEHLEVRLSQVHGKIDEFFRDFAVDPETGKPKDFLSTPAAMRYLSERMRATRAQVEGAAYARVEQRYKGEALGHAAAKLRSQALDGSPLDLAEARAVLPPTISSDEIRAMYISTVIATATELEGTGRLEDARRLTNQAATLAGITLPESPPQALSVPEAAPKAPPRVSFDALAGAVKHVESGGSDSAVSPKGAVGSMQTMPFTLTDPGFGVTPAKDQSPAERERVGRDYLRAMLKRYNGSYVKALAAYNAGPGKVDEWLARTGKVTDAEFARLIPFEETRSYVGNVLSRAGVQGYTGANSPGDAVAANPDFIREPEELDPVKRADGGPWRALAPQLAGDLELRPEERERLMEFRETLGNRISERWEREHHEAQNEAAGEFMLRLNGQGIPATSQEVAEAARTRRISPQQAASLFDMLRTNANQAENAADRATARADREEARRQARNVDTIVASYLGPIVSGIESPQSARARLLREARHITDPKVRKAVIDQVGVLANSVESLRTNSAPVRNIMSAIDEREQAINEAITGMPRGRGPLIAARMKSEMDVARARVARSVLDGGDPLQSWNSEASRLAGVWDHVTARPQTK